MLGAQSSAGRQLGKALGAFGQDLEAVPVRPGHDIEHALDVGERHAVVEQIAHRVDEHGLRLLPPEWQLQHVRLQCRQETAGVVGLAHGLQSRGHALGVAVLAARTDLGAARHGVPRGFGPFDGRLGRHLIHPSRSRCLRKRSCTILAATRLL